MFRVTNVQGSVNTPHTSHVSVNNSVLKYSPLNVDLGHNLGYGFGKLALKIYEWISSSFLKEGTRTKFEIGSNENLKKDPLVSRERRSVQQGGEWPASFNLASLNGTNGFSVPGLSPGSEFGFSVNSAGDFNGDGKGDLVAGALYASPGGLSKAGTSYILFGQVKWPSVFNVATLNGTNGFSIPGLGTGDDLGYSVSTADINGDGKSDLILSAFGASPGGRSLAGNAYILFGQSNVPALFNLTSLNGTNGLSIPGLAAGDGLGSSVASAGDINGDGIPDLILGASGASPGGKTSAGAAYFLFGHSSGWPASFNLASLNGINGFSIQGTNAGDHLGGSVSSAGDVNGDGFSDLVLGAYGASPGGKSSAGTAYVLFGQRGSWPAILNLTSLNGTNGFSIGGLNADDYFGLSVNSAGDINNDGYSDLIFGAFQASSGGFTQSGSVYLLFGQSSSWPATYNLDTLNGANGFLISGLSAGSYLGYSVSSAGDLNGDGISDFVLGANQASSGGLANAGNSYILFGHSNGWPALLNLNLLNGTNGFSVPGIATSDNLGCSVSEAGDLNSDGISDLVLGARGANSQTGAIYVLFGTNNRTSSMINPTPQTSTGLSNPSPINTINSPSSLTTTSTTNLPWPASFNLATLNGINGFSIPGISPGEELGYSVNPAGDINGDGIGDLLLGAPGSQTGAAYILFGQMSGWPAPFNLATLNGSNGIAVSGLAKGDFLGSSVSTAGDLNGDGIADLVLGAPYASPTGLSKAGSAYVMFGHATGWPATFNLTSLNGANGFVVNGLAAGDYLGSSVATSGDINGDGKGDLVLGAYYASPAGATQAGSAYVLFGQARGMPAAFDLTTLNGSNGFAVNGLTAGDQLGYSVSTAGDINGDGKDDLVLGAYHASPGGHAQAGSAYILFGRASNWPSTFNLNSLDGTNGFAVKGIAQGDSLGVSVSSAGDINGDGLDDLILGATYSSPGGLSQAGSAYALFGHASGWPAAFNLTIVNGTNGFIVNGPAAGDALGFSVNTAGDLNNDGISDLVLGAYKASPNGLASAGSSYVLFGKTGNWPASVNLNLLNGTNGFNVPGIAANANLGNSVSSAGDFNGDGITDLLLGASGSNSQAGAAYVLFGMNKSTGSIVTPSPQRSTSLFNPSPLNTMNSPSSLTTTLTSFNSPSLNFMNSPMSQTTSTTSGSNSPPVNFVNSPVSQTTSTTSGSNPPPVNFVNSPVSQTTSTTSGSNSPPVNFVNSPMSQTTSTTSGSNSPPVNFVNSPMSQTTSTTSGSNSPPVNFVNSPMSQTTSTTSGSNSPPVNFVNSPMSQTTSTTSGSNSPPVNPPMAQTTTGVSNPPPVTSANFPIPKSLSSSTSSRVTTGINTPIPNDATHESVAKMILIVPLVLGILRREFNNL